MKVFFSTTLFLFLCLSAQAEKHPKILPELKQVMEKIEKGK